MTWLDAVTFTAGQAVNVTRKIFEKERHGDVDDGKRGFMTDKTKLDKLIKKCEITIVGDGYVDMICPWENIGMFIAGVSQLGIVIEGFTWWCNVTGTHRPCGMGGPHNKYGDNWYSEIEMGKVHEFASNEATLKFLLEEWKEQSDYKACYVPGFWLCVPNGWKSRNQTGNY